jgi:hypothetical protein
MSYLRTLATSIILVLVLVGYVKGDPIKLTTGKAGNVNADFIFTLIAEDGAQKKFTVPIPANTTDLAKAELIKAAVLQQGQGDWDAVRNGANLTFKHKLMGTNSFTDVKKIGEIIDGTAEKNIISCAGLDGGRFGFGLADTLAAGFDGEGHPSFVSVATSRGSAFVPINQGDTTLNLINALYTQLQNAGVDILRTSPTTFLITDLSAGAFITFQVTDLNIIVMGASGECAVPEPATLLLLSTGLAGVAMKTRKRL